MTDKKINKITFSNTYNNPQLDSVKKGEDTFNSVFSEEDQLQQLKEEEEKLIAQLQKGGGQNEIKQLAEIKKEIQTLKNQIEEEKETNAKELSAYSKEMSEKELDALEKQISLEKASKMTPQEEKRRKAAQEFYNKKQNSFLNLSKEEQETLEKDTVGTLDLLLNSGKETIAEQDKEDGIIARGANKVREFFGGKTTKQKVEAQFQTQENFINELKEADSPEKFAQIYKENTGVEFDPEKIQKFNETKNYSTIANAGLAKCSDFQEALKKETFTGQELINATRKFYGCSQDEAITKLNEYAKSEKGGKYSFDKNGNLSVTSTVYAIKGPTEVTKTYKPNEVGSEIKSHKEGDIISQAYSGFNGYAQYCTDQYNKNFEKATGKSIKEISEDYSKYAKEALGTSGFNGELVNKYCEKQETVTDRVSSGVSIAGMTMMVGGYAAAPVTAGASIAVAQVGTGMALGGQFLDEGLDLVDEVTSENGLSKEEGLALLKETATDAALVSSGFAINKVSSGVNELVLTKMGSKVIAKAAEVGADASLGIYADYIITGDVDLTGEGISQGISIITGISMGKLATGKVKTTKPTQPDFQKISPNSNDFEINGTVIKNPKKTQTQIPETKNISEMNIFEKTAQGINETSPKKIILSDSIETQKPLILSDETPSQKIIFGDEYNTDTSRYPTRDGYKEKQYIYPTAKGYGSREVEFDSVENTFKTTEIKAYSENWNMKGKDTKVIDTKYTKEGVLKSKTTKESHSTYDQNSKEIIKGETLVSENYIDGSKIKAEYIVDDAENRILKSQVKTYKNPKTGLPETHIMELSDVDGIFNSKIIDANGNEKIECFAQKDGGTTKVEKNLESLNGTKTHYTYESKLDGDDVKMFYQITSKDGKVLSTIDRTFTRIDENTAASEINGHRYTMTKTKDGIEVQDIARGTTTEVKYSSVLSDYTDKEMRMLMDKMSGDQLLDLAKQGTKLTTSHVNNSFYKFSENEIISENNLFVYSHEAGHAKDISVNKADNYSRDYAISSEKQFRETFEKEKAEFKKAFPDVQEDYIDYFIKGPYNDALAGTGETVAEINAMFSTATGANELAIRTYELQKYFPETIAMASRKLNTDSNIAISGDTKLNPSTNEQFIPQINNSKRKIAYNKPVAQNQVATTEKSAKLKNFEISEKDFENSVKAFGEEETYKNIEILNQLKNLNMFRDANLTLEDIPNIKNTLYGRADNSIDFDPEKLLSKYEMTLSTEEQFEIALKREISYEDARKLTQSLNSNYTRAIDTKYLTDIGSSKNIMCQEPEISKAKSITPENPTKFTESMIESNMVTKELITAYDKMLTSTDGRAAEIAERVNKKNIVLTDNSGSEEIVKFEDLFEKAKSNPDKLTPSEIHAITDVFKNEVYVNKATTDFFNPYLNDEICDAKGEFLPQYKQIAGSVESMKNISTKSLNKNVEITDHAFMRLIDRDLINPTTKNGELVSFNELISTANKAVLEAEKTNNLKNVVLKDIYTSEGQEIKLIVKKNASGKIVIESFM